MPVKRFIEGPWKTSVEAAFAGASAKAVKGLDLSDYHYFRVSEVLVREKNPVREYKVILSPDPPGS